MLTHTGSELETLKLLFKEKERELSVALNKIDTLTKQLDDINKNHHHVVGGTGVGVTYGNKNSMELENLKQELLVNIYSHHSTLYIFNLFWIMLYY